MIRLLAASIAGACFWAFVTFSAVAQPQFDSPPLPDGKGKQLVQDLCTSCHPRFVFSFSGGHTRQGWAALTATMIDLSGSPEERDTILDYLAENFPPEPEIRPYLIPGDKEIEFKEWVTPTLGQRARDPIEAPNGMIWWAGMWGDIVGRINPETGEMKEYMLPSGAQPHSVTVDDAGHVWYTGNGNGTVGRIDPETGDIKVYEMPDPAAKDPHTPIFDDDGILWFTLQRSNMIGRLDPETGEIDLATMPRSGSLPYGIKIDEDGNPWVACNGNNCLVEIDPETMEMSEVTLPEGSTVRRLDFAADGTIWYVNSSLGRLGHYDPETDELEEWPTPSGADSHPYAIQVIDGIVWFNESRKRPDPLVRFDPETETFQSWPIPSGGVYSGIVRRMMPTADGNLLIHQSATNRIIRVDLNPE